MKKSIFEILKDIKENYSVEYYDMLLLEFEEYEQAIEILHNAIKDYITSKKEGEKDE